MGRLLCRRGVLHWRTATMCYAARKPIELLHRAVATMLVIPVARQHAHREQT